MAATAWGDAGTRSIAYFDCETDGLHADCSIVCACVSFDDGTTKVFVEDPPGGLHEDTAEALRDLLCRHTVVTHNGVGFDFRILANHLRRAAPQDIDKRRALVRCCADSYDLCLDHFTSVGYPASMQSFLVGCGLGTKTWSGAESAVQWKDNIEKVVAYCTADTLALKRVACSV